MGHGAWRHAGAGVGENKEGFPVGGGDLADDWGGLLCGGARSELFPACGGGLGFAQAHWLPFLLQEELKSQMSCGTYHM